MSRYVLTDPAGDPENEEACSVLLCVDQQSFYVTREPCDDAEHAEWFRRMTAIALQRMMAHELNRPRA